MRDVLDELLETFSKARDIIIDCEPRVGELVESVMWMGHRTVCLCNEMEEGRYLRRRVGIVP